MKLTMEIKDEKFSYEYIIGNGERQSGDSPLSSDSLKHFTNCIDICNKLWMNQIRLIDEELIAKCYLERHPELLKGKAQHELANK